MTHSGLVARGVVKRFGGVVAVDHVDLDVPLGRVTAVVGPNGAGKTTLFDCLTGHAHADEGSVHLGDLGLTRLGPADRAKAGLGRTFQRLELFTGMSVFDNLLVAAEAATLRPLWAELLRPLPSGPAATATARRVLDGLGLSGLADVPAGELPTGTLRLVELGRALCTSPRVLLLDEPASGLDNAEIAALRAAVRQAASDGLGVLMVEHHLDLVLDVSDDVYVLDMGRVVVHGTAQVVRDHPEMRRVYLGAEASGGART